ncbi:MAG: DUF4339 domain-containing protein, partial [Planctomycetota bacterium]
MGVRFACHHCGRKLHIKNELAGRRGVCPQCAGRFRIPDDDSPFSKELVDKSSKQHAAEVTSNDFESPESNSEDRRTQQGDGDSADSEVSESGTLAVLQRSSVLQRSAASTNELESSAVWYVRPADGGQYGPADGERLAQWIDEGRVATSSLVWRDGWPQWR